MNNWRTSLQTPIERFAYTKVEAAKALGLSLRTIDNLIAAKELTVRRIGRRVIIPATSLQALIRSDRRTGQRRTNNDEQQAA
jgi:excisionase family DNA binding protein